MMQGLVDLDLADQFLPCSGFYKRVFGDYFGCQDLLGLHVSNFKALSEATFSKKFALLVLFNSYIAVNLRNLFFDNLNVIRVWLICIIAF